VAVNGAQETSRSGPSATVLSIAHTGDRAADGSSGAQKVNHSLSKLQKLILVRAADGGVRRADVVAEFYGLERRYRGHHDEACLSRPREREYQRQYHCAQATVTRALRRLEARGLVQPVRTAGGYAKRIKLTDDGRQVVDTLRVEGRTK